jgi:hypothetical protein
MFAAIRFYRAEPHSIDEVVRRVQEDFLPLVRDMSGSCRISCCSLVRGKTRSSR